MILKLHNRKSDTYHNIKRTVLSPDFLWNYMEGATLNLSSSDDHEDIPCMSHGILIRPSSYDGILFPQPIRPSIDFVLPFLAEICEDNNLKVNSYMRISVNATLPTSSNKLTIPHVDHQFPHKNIIVYFTDAGGETVVYDENHNPHCHFPEEDDIINFDGKYLHCIRPPKQKRRIVLVATYI